MRDPARTRYARPSEKLAPRRWIATIPPPVIITDHARRPHVAPPRGWLACPIPFFLRATRGVEDPLLADGGLRSQDRTRSLWISLIYWLSYRRHLSSIAKSIRIQIDGRASLDDDSQLPLNKVLTHCDAW